MTNKFCRPTPLAPDWRDSARFMGIFHAPAESCPQAESMPARQQVKPIVGQSVI
ncbi:MAG: hypothetical protein ACK4RS_05700 [Thiothrix sp.]